MSEIESLRSAFLTRSASRPRDPPMMKVMLDLPLVKHVCKVAAKPSELFFSPLTSNIIRNVPSLSLPNNLAASFFFTCSSCRALRESGACSSSTSSSCRSQKRESRETSFLASPLSNRTCLIKAYGLPIAVVEFSG